MCLFLHKLALFYFWNRVQSAQQHLQALQAQYPHMANGNAAYMMEGPREEGGMQQMPVHPEDAAQQEPAAPQKGSVSTLMYLRESRLLYHSYECVMTKNVLWCDL